MSRTKLNTKEGQRTQTETIKTELTLRKRSGIWAEAKAHRAERFQEGTSTSRCNKMLRNFTILQKSGQRSKATLRKVRTE